MRKNILLVFLIAITLILQSCEKAYKPAHGAEDEIIVVADTAEFDSLKSSLCTIFEKVIYTPQPEKMFHLKRISLNEIENYQTNKNIILLASLNSSANTSKFVKALIDTSKSINITVDNDRIIPKYNLWAKNQLVMILTAPDISHLEECLEQHKESIFNAFHNISDKRLYESLHNSKFEKLNTEGMLLKQYGWIVCVPSDFTIAENEPDENYICLKSSSGKDMGKWIFVHWIDNASPLYLNEDSIRTIRNRLTASYYNYPGISSFIKIGNDNCIHDEYTFNGKYALLTQGLWEDTKETEGPFINYTFYDVNSKRVYMIDGSINAPDYYKRNLIQQLDVLLKSFKTKAELTNEKQDELLKAAE